MFAEPRMRTYDHACGHMSAYVIVRPHAWTSVDACRCSCTQRRSRSVREGCSRCECSHRNQHVRLQHERTCMRALCECSIQAWCDSIPAPRCLADLLIRASDAAPCHHCLRTTCTICRHEPSHCASLRSQHGRLSGIPLHWPDSLELAAR